MIERLALLGSVAPRIIVELLLNCDPGRKALDLTGRDRAAPVTFALRDAIW